MQSIKCHKNKVEKVVKTFLHLGVANAYKASVHTEKFLAENKTFIMIS